MVWLLVAIVVVEGSLRFCAIQLLCSLVQVIPTRWLVNFESFQLGTPLRSPNGDPDWPVLETPQADSFLQNSDQSDLRKIFWVRSRDYSFDLTSKISERASIRDHQTWPHFSSTPPHNLSQPSICFEQLSSDQHVVLPTSPSKALVQLHALLSQLLFSQSLDSPRQRSKLWDATLLQRVSRNMRLRVE